LGKMWLNSNIYYYIFAHVTKEDGTVFFSK
jgi:hypothetical protein